ncbi:MAG: DUF47 domain-containing protein [Candidatus Omnitrophota bacterium]
MFKSLFPKDAFFFDKFDKISVYMVEGAEILFDMIHHGGDYGDSARRLKQLEHNADQVAHEIIAHIHKSFITPIDREDIFHFVNRLDDILDLTESAACRIDLYQPKTVPNGAKDLARVLLESTKLVQEMIGHLHNLKKSERILLLTIDIKRLENEADTIRRQILTDLFKEEKDVFELIKWKDILEYMEKSTDRCEDVANITEGIVIENT